jgi:hypothetical protein
MEMSSLSVQYLLILFRNLRSPKHLELGEMGFLAVDRIKKLWVSLGFYCNISFLMKKCTVTWHLLAKEV